MVAVQHNKAENMESKNVTSSQRLKRNITLLDFRQPSKTEAKSYQKMLIFLHHCRKTVKNEIKLNQMSYNLVI